MGTVYCHYFLYFLHRSCLYWLLNNLLLMLPMMNCPSFPKGCLFIIRVWKILYQYHCGYNYENEAEAEPYYRMILHPYQQLQLYHLLLQLIRVMMSMMILIFSVSRMALTIAVVVHGIQTMPHGQREELGLAMWRRLELGFLDQY